MNELSLFSGAGGGLLGSKLLGWRAVGYVEFNVYCQKVIAARIADGALHEAPIFGDIRAFISEGYAARYQGMVDVVTAGFPCQPFSIAGAQHGAEDDRNMWPETADIIRLVHPGRVLLENVPGLASSGYLGRVLGDLAELGYDAQWGCLSAADVGAPHLRRRIWIAATDTRCVSILPDMQRKSDPAIDTRRDGAQRALANPDGVRELQPEGRVEDFGRRSSDCRLEGRCEHWPAEPDVCRVAHGVARGMDRLRALGNGQVPQVVRAAWGELG